MRCPVRIWFLSFGATFRYAKSSIGIGARTVLRVCYGMSGTERGEQVEIVREKIVKEREEVIKEVLPP